MGSEFDLKNKSEQPQRQCDEGLKAKAQAEMIEQLLREKSLEIDEKRRLTAKLVGVKESLTELWELALKLGGESYLAQGNPSVLDQVNLIKDVLSSSAWKNTED